MSHQPGRINDRRGQNKPPPPPERPKTGKELWFSEDFIPARGYVLLERRFIGSSSKIIIPENVHSEQHFALVRAVGPGKHHFNGTIIEPEWKVGDFVFGGLQHATTVVFKGKDGIEKTMSVLGTEHILGKFANVPQAVLDEFDHEKSKAEAPKLAESSQEAPEATIHPIDGNNA